MFSSKMLEALTFLRWFKAGVFLGMLTGPLCSEAAETVISARYNGNASGEFESTTPEAAYCKRFPGRCGEYKLFTANLPITYDRQSVHGSPDPRRQFYLKAPASRTVRVTHDKGIDAHELQFEITHLSQGLTNDPRFPGGGESGVHGLRLRRVQSCRGNSRRFDELLPAGRSFSRKSNRLLLKRSRGQCG